MTPRELRRLILLYLYQGRSGLSWTTDIMSEELGASKNKVKAEIKYLQEKGFIKILQQEYATGFSEYDKKNYEFPELTAKGVDFIENEEDESKEKMGGVNIANIHNSNVSLNSTNTKQANQKIVDNIKPHKRDSRNKWFWWAMSIVAGVIILLISAYVFGVGR